ncbi:MAG: hypothetical protein HYY45_11440 [Deltaproteobacteria bacterium]|nr:hypothetical protein [Deltaproteobacteria bacterium]
METHSPWLLSSSTFSFSSIASGPPSPESRSLSAWHAGALLARLFGLRERTSGSGSKKTIATINWDLEPIPEYGGNRYPPLATDIDPEHESLIERRWKEYGF